MTKTIEVMKEGAMEALVYECLSIMAVGSFIILTLDTGKKLYLPAKDLKWVKEV